MLWRAEVLSHVTERVKTLHALGVAHRDLKPGNVLWRPLEHSWTLIYFGCAAEISARPQDSSLCFTEVSDVHITAAV